MPWNGCFELFHDFVAGDSLFIPFNILKEPEVVACAVRNQISPMALSAVTKTFISSGGADISKFNLEHSQAHRYVLICRNHNSCL